MNLSLKSKTLARGLKHGETQFTSYFGKGFFFCWKNRICFFGTRNHLNEVGLSACCWRDCGWVFGRPCTHHLVFSLSGREWAYSSRRFLDLRCDLSFAFFYFFSLYLGNIPKDLNKSETHRLKIIMMKQINKCITKYWLRRSTPSTVRPINIINSIWLMEKMAFTLLHSPKIQVSGDIDMMTTAPGSNQN